MFLQTKACFLHNCTTHDREDSEAAVLALLGFVEAEEIPDGLLPMIQLSKLSTAEDFTKRKKKQAVN